MRSVHVFQPCKSLTFPRCCPRHIPALARVELVCVAVRCGWAVEYFRRCCVCVCFRSIFMSTQPNDDIPKTKRTTTTRKWRRHYYFSNRKVIAVWWIEPVPNNKKKKCGFFILWAEKKTAILSVFRVCVCVCAGSAHVSLNLLVSTKNQRPTIEWQVKIQRNLDFYLPTRMD